MYILAERRDDGQSRNTGRMRGDTSRIRMSHKPAAERGSCCKVRTSSPATFSLLQEFYSDVAGCLTAGRDDAVSTRALFVAAADGGASMLIGLELVLTNSSEHVGNGGVVRRVD